MRRDILGAVLRTIADEGRTVLFSSHLLEEVEQVADHVTMIRLGEIMLSAPLATIKESHYCLTVRFAEFQRAPPSVAGILRWDGTGLEWTAVCRRGSGDVRGAIAGWGAHIVGERASTLDEIFVAHVGTSATPAVEA